MVTKLGSVFLAIVLLASCSTIRPVNSGASRAAISSPDEATTARGSRNNVKFLDDITLDASSSKEKPVYTSNTASHKENNAAARLFPDRSPSVEKMSAIQLKYAILLNMEVEQLNGLNLLPFVDEWYGTPYRMGGTGKTGVDCSAFVKAVYLSAFGVTLPRTAREQYRSARILSATELKEGDLVFFNTRGGVSHVGIYLTNNKFVHASTSQGVTVSDLFDPYYLKRFLGSGRIEKPDMAVTANQ